MAMNEDTDEERSERRKVALLLMTVIPLAVLAFQKTRGGPTGQDVVFEPGFGTVLLGPFSAFLPAPHGAISKYFSPLESTIVAVVGLGLVVLGFFVTTEKRPTRRAVRLILIGIVFGAWHSCGAMTCMVYWGS